MRRLLLLVFTISLITSAFCQTRIGNGSLKVIDGIGPLSFIASSPPNIMDYAAQGAHTLQQLAAGQFADVEAAFDVRTAHDMPQESLSAQWKELVAQAGPFTRVKTTIVTSKLGGYHVVTMACVFQRASEGAGVSRFHHAGDAVRKLTLEY
jgi:hypothetical protein